MTVKLSRIRGAFLATTSVALICTALTASAAIPPASGVSANAAVRQLVSDAQKAIKAGKLPLAVIDLKNASSADPRNGAVRAELGAVLAQTGDYYSAERELRQARKDGAADQIVLPSLFQTMLARNEQKMLLDEFPEPNATSNMAPEILRARALAFADLGQPANAIDAMDKSLKLRRDLPGLLLRSRIAQKARALPSALQFADAALAMDPNNLEALLVKVGLLLESNNVNAASTLVDQIVAKFPSNLPAQFTRIEVLMRKNEDAAAKSAVDVILAKEPTNGLGIYYRAVLLARRGDNKNAWRIAQSLPKEFVSTQPGMALMVAQMADQSGNSETGAAILAATVGRFPQNTQLRLRLAGIRLKQNDINGALNALEPIEDLLDPAATEALAAIYIKSNKPSMALGVLEKITQSGKGTDATTLELVNLEARMGQSEQALKDLTAAVSQKPTDAVLANQLVNALIGGGRFAEALAVADKLGTDQSQKLASLALRAQVFLAEGKLTDALASYTAAIQLDPKSKAALYGHASVLERMQKYDDASNDIHSILNLDARDSTAYLKLAEIASLQNQDAKVRNILKQAIQQLPQDPAPRISLARYLVTRNDRPGALGALNDLLKIHPDNKEGLALIGSVQQAMGKKTEAIATFRRLVSLTPRVPQSQILLGNALFASGDHAGANAALKSAVSLATASPDVRLAQINLLFAEKDIAGAIASAQAYKDANPGISADLLLGETLERAGRRDQAMATYQKSFSTNPNNTTLMRIAAISVAHGDIKTAADDFENWLKTNPGDDAIRLQYATLLTQQKDNEKAVRQFREILKKDPNNVPALNGVAWLTRDEEPTDAMALATKAASLAPNSPDVLDTLGWLKLKHGTPDEGLSLLKRAHDLRPQDGEISYHLVLGLDATGSHDTARGFLKALLKSQVKFDDLEKANKLAQTWN